MFPFHSYNSSGIISGRMWKNWGIISGRGSFRVLFRSILGSFKNEALENEDRSTKHPKLENEAPKTRKRSTQISKTKHPKLENEAPKTRNLSVL